MDGYTSMANAATSELVGGTWFWPHGTTITDSDAGCEGAGTFADGVTTRITTAMKFVGGAWDWPHGTTITDKWADGDAAGAFAIGSTASIAMTM